MTRKASLDVHAETSLGLLLMWSLEIAPITRPVKVAGSGMIGILASSLKAERAKYF